MRENERKINELCTDFAFTAVKCNSSLKIENIFDKRIRYNTLIETQIILGFAEYLIYEMSKVNEILNLLKSDDRKKEFIKIVNRNADRKIEKNEIIVVSLEENLTSYLNDGDINIPDLFLDILNYKELYFPIFSITVKFSNDDFKLGEEKTLKMMDEIEDLFDLAYPNDIYIKDQDTKQFKIFRIEPKLDIRKIKEDGKWTLRIEYEVDLFDFRPVFNFRKNIYKKKICLI